MSDFKTSLENIKRKIATINRDIQKYQQKKSNNQHIGTLIGEIKGQFKTIEKDIETFNQTIQNQIENPDQYGINYKEAERRKNLVNELVNQKNQSKKQFENVDNLIKENATETKSLNFNTKNRFQDQYDTENMNNQQMLDAQKQEKAKQEDKLDALIDTTARIKQVGVQIGNELDDQKEIIDDLEIGMDRNTVKMGKTENKMKKLINTSSNLCLGITIFVEIAVLVLILIFL